MAEVATKGYAFEVARGMEWLDEVAPGWEERIDVDKLSLWSFDDCPLGQLGLWERSASPVLINLDSHGFNVLATRKGLPSVEAFNALTEEWKLLIKDRLERQDA